jgi:UDP-N-acetylglucosamine--N-acetylmuramyl-(pentapeptide) pyrophosphoryl-undecaprenol N-acetylglucosamine transferase
MPKRVLIACGGTGGHLAPGIALAQKLTARGHRCELLISSKQVDQRLSQKYPELVFKVLPAVALGKTHSKISPVGLTKFAWSQLSSLWFCSKVLENFRPHAVVGFGGFVTVSAGLSAKLRGIPLFLHEANYKVGRTNRLLAPLAKTVWLPPGIEKHGIPAHKAVELGLPFRTDMQRVSREEARRALGIPLRGKLIIVLGGSQGGTNLNRWAEENMEAVLETGTHLYCVMGLGKGEARVVERQLPLGQIAKAVFLSFSDQMHLLYSAADLFISRAGASTIAELIQLKIPSILVPYPYSADNHQWANAANLERQGGSIVVDESNLDNLLNEVLYALKSDSLLGGLYANLSRIDRGDPALAMAIAIERVKSAKETRIFNRGTDLESRFGSLLARARINPDAIRLAFNEPLGPKTTFGIGGPARIWAEPTNIHELSQLLKIAKKLNIPAFCLGRGSNLLVLDSGFDGLVFRLGHPNWQKVDFVEKGRVKAYAGVRLKALCGEMARMGMEGFEFMEGIPATLGGALRMNAGAFGGWIFDRVEKVCYMTLDGQIRQLPATKMGASYRSTATLKNSIALWAILKPAQKGSTEDIRKTIDTYQGKRKTSQPREPSAGCVFRNPSKDLAAGQLIDAATLKGQRVGGAKISEIHANFIVNDGNASAQDVITLVNQVRQRVWADKKIALQPEIMLLGGNWNDYLIPLKDE